MLGRIVRHGCVLVEFGVERIDFVADVLSMQDVVLHPPIDGESPVDHKVVQVIPLIVRVLGSLLLVIVGPAGLAPLVRTITSPLVY